MAAPPRPAARAKPRGPRTEVYIFGHDSIFTMRWAPHSVLLVLLSQAPFGALVDK
jgi:hypothetical protein